MPALKPATIGQKFLTDCGQNRPLTTLDQSISVKSQDASAVAEAQKSINRILKDNNLISDDIKGIEIDLGY